MIPRSADWKNALADAVRDPAELLALLGLPRELLPGARRAAAAFPLRVPRGYVARMRPGDPEDPLLRQVLPLGEELEDMPGFVSDPVGDLDAARQPGLLQKYQGRVLLIASGACAVNCRYCFRRHFPYGEENALRRNWEANRDHIRDDQSIREVILSGGDPLVLPDDPLGAVAREIAAIPHVRRLRIHTRLPVVLPSRVDERLLGWVEDLDVPVVMVIHANHPAEITPDVGRSLDRLRRAGATLLNQAVLLRGVNDDADALAQLSEALFDHGVLPYYLHLLDPTRGTAHFDVDDTRGETLVEALRARLPGFLVPRLVREIAGEPSKTPIR